MKTCKCRIACASNGGPIATTRDERQMVVVTGSTMTPSISVFNALGSPLCTIPWDQALVAGLGWTQDEDLLVVSKTGQVALPSVHVLSPDVSARCLEKLSRNATRPVRWNKCGIHLSAEKGSKGLVRAVIRF